MPQWRLVDVDDVVTIGERWKVVIWQGTEIVAMTLRTSFENDADDDAQCDDPYRRPEVSVC